MVGLENQGNFLSDVVLCLNLGIQSRSRISRFSYFGRPESISIPNLEILILRLSRCVATHRVHLSRGKRSSYCHNIATYFWQIFKRLKKSKFDIKYLPHRSRWELVLGTTWDTGTWTIWGYQALILWRPPFPGNLFQSGGSSKFGGSVLWWLHTIWVSLESPDSGLSKYGAPMVVRWSGAEKIEVKFHRSKVNFWPNCALFQLSDLGFGLSASKYMGISEKTNPHSRLGNIHSVCCRDSRDLESKSRSRQFKSRRCRSLEISLVRPRSGPKIGCHSLNHNYGFHSLFRRLPSFATYFQFFLAFDHVQVWPTLQHTPEGSWSEYFTGSFMYQLNACTDPRVATKSLNNYEK